MKRVLLTWLALLLLSLTALAQTTESIVIAPAPFKVTLDLTKSIPNFKTNKLESLFFTLENLQTTAITVWLEQPATATWSWGNHQKVLARKPLPLGGRQVVTGVVEGISTLEGTLRIATGPTKTAPKEVGFYVDSPFDLRILPVLTVPVATWTAQAYVIRLPVIGDWGRIAANQIPLLANANLETLTCPSKPKSPELGYPIATGVVASQHDVLALRLLAAECNDAQAEKVQKTKSLTLEMKGFSSASDFNNVAAPGQYEGTIAIPIQGGKPEDQLRVRINVKYEWWVAAGAIVLGLGIGYLYRKFIFNLMPLQQYLTRGLEMQRDTVDALLGLQNEGRQEQAYPKFGAAIASEATVLEPAILNLVSKTAESLGTAVKDARFGLSDQINATTTAKIEQHLQDLAALKAKFSKLIVYRGLMDRKNLQQISLNAKNGLGLRSNDASILEEIKLALSNEVSELDPPLKAAEYLYQSSADWESAYNKLQSCLGDFNNIQQKLNQTILDVGTNNFLQDKLTDSKQLFADALNLIWNNPTSDFGAFYTALSTATIHLEGVAQEINNATGTALKVRTLDFTGIPGSISKPAVVVVQSLTQQFRLAQSISFGTTWIGLLLLLATTIFSGLNTLYFNNPSYGDTEIWTSIAWGLGAKVLADNAANLIPMLQQVFKPK